MKDVLMAQLPKCNFCAEFGKEVKAEFDAPTIFRPWAYMCKNCLSVYGSANAQEIGYHLVVQIQETIL